MEKSKGERERVVADTHAHETQQDTSQQLNSSSIVTTINEASK